MPQNRRGGRGRTEMRLAAAIVRTITARISESLRQKGEKGNVNYGRLQGNPWSCGGCRHDNYRHEECVMADDERLVSLLQRRTAARAAKDYATADQLSLRFTRVPGVRACVAHLSLLLSPSPSLTVSCTHTQAR